MKHYAALEIISAEYGDQHSLRHLAHRADFTYAPRPGYLYVRSRAISSRTNDNFDDFPAEEIEKGYRSFIGKPVFVNHVNEDHKRARGVVIDAALHHDVNPNGSPDTWCEVLMEVDALRFPKLAQAIVQGHIDRTSMGVDVEYSICSACGNKATNPAEYCRHIPQMKGSKIVRRNAATNRPEETLIFETCYGLSFFENSLLVEDPADPTAYFLGVDDRGLRMAQKTAHRKLCRQCLTSSSCAAYGCGRSSEGLGAFVASTPGNFDKIPQHHWDYLSDLVDRVGQREKTPKVCWQVFSAIDHKLGYPQESGYYRGEGHYWNRLPDGSILDASHDQFEEDDDPVRIFAPGDPEHGHFKTAVRHQEGLGAFVAAHDLDEAVTSFKPYAEEQGWHDPTCVGGQCDVASTEFAQHLHEHGIPHEVVTHYPEPGGPMSHSVVEVGDHTVDWTARQFDPKADFPHIEPHHVTRSRWHRTEPYYGEIEYGKDYREASLAGDKSWIKEEHDYEGRHGERRHITRTMTGALPTHLVQHLMGVKGEIPGEHRNKQGQQWEDFKSDIAQNGIKNPIFITQDPGERPKISEGNHRRDAAVELGHPYVPVEMRYFGHAEQDPDNLEDKAQAHFDRENQIRSLGTRRLARYEPEPDAPEEGEYEKEPDPSGFFPNGIATRWRQAHKPLVADALHAWKGDPVNALTHWHHELNDDPQPDSGSGKQMRAQSGALRWELQNNSKTFGRKLYRGVPTAQDRLPKVGDIIDHDDRPRGYSSNRATAWAFARKSGSDHLRRPLVPVTYQTAPGTQGLRIKDYGTGSGLDQSEQEYVLHGQHQVTHVESTDKGLHVRTRPLQSYTAGLRGFVAARGDDPGLDEALDQLGEILSRPSHAPPPKILPEAHEMYGGYIHEHPSGHLHVSEAPGALSKPLEKLYRIVHPKEWEEAQQKGYLQSNTAFSPGYTRASAQPDERWRRQSADPSEIAPKGHTIEIDYHPDDNWHASAEGYAATRSKIPLSRVRKMAKTEVSVAGLAVLAADTGRVLMLQRANHDVKDPAAGTWEFPGGHLNPDEAPVEGAIREWKEELGCKLPAGHVQGHWISKKIYQGFVYVIEHEDEVDINHDHENRQVLNPDDPDGDEIEVAAWFEPKDLPDMPALRDEVKSGTDWSKLKLKKTAGLEAFLAAYYHVSPHWLPSGTKLTPGGGRRNFGGRADSDAVYMAGSEGEAEQWGNAMAQDEPTGHLHIYEVQPHGPVTHSQGHVTMDDFHDVIGQHAAPAATIVRHHYSYDPESGEAFYPHEAGLGALAAAEPTFYHGTSDDLEPGSQLSVEEATRRQPEVAKALEDRGGQHISFTTDYQHAQMYAGVRAQTRGGTPRVYRVQPTGGYEPNPADEKWREGKPPMSFRTKEPVTVLGEATPPKRRRKQSGLMAFVAVNASDEVPPEPGLSPIPEGHVRLFHQTGPKHVESIRQNGLTMEHARATGGPVGVWASHGTRFYPGQDHATVEFHVPYKELQDTAGGQSPHRHQPQEDWEQSNHHTLVIPRSIKPHEITAIHEPWHDRYRYFHNEGMTDEVKQGGFDNLKDIPDYGRAIDKIKSEASLHLAMNTEDEVPPRLGTAPIPEGHVRLYHHTWSKNVPSIREHGLLAEMGKGDSGKGYGNELSAGVWAASQHPEPDPQSDRHVIEFHAHPSEIDVNGPSPGQDVHKWQQGDHNVLMRGSVKPENILAIHAPWHTAYHQINDDPRDREDVKNGKLDWVHNDPSMPGVSKAVHKIQAEGAARPNIGKGWWLTPEGKKIGVYDHYETTPGMARQMIRPHMAESGQVRVRSFNNQLNVQTARPFTDKQRQSLLMDADRHSRMFVDVLHPDTEESIHSESGGPEEADRMLARAHRAAIPHEAKRAVQGARKVTQVPLQHILTHTEPTDMASYGHTWPDAFRDIEENHEDFAPKHWGKFLDHVQAHGIQTPVVILHDGERQKLFSGHHRVWAAHRLGLSHVPAYHTDDPSEAYDLMDEQAAHESDWHKQAGLSTFIAIEAHPDSYHTLYRGLHFGEIEPHNIDDFHKNPQKYMGHEKNVGIHWTDNPDSAYNFATDRDPEGWAHEGDPDEEQGHLHGVILEGRVHPRHIIDPESEEGQGYAMSDAILGHEHPENEVTVRGDARVHVHKIHAITEHPETGENRWTTHNVSEHHLAVQYEALGPYRKINVEDIKRNMIIRPSWGQHDWTRTTGDAQHDPDHPDDTSREFPDEDDPDHVKMYVIPIHRTFTPHQPEGTPYHVRVRKQAGLEGFIAAQGPTYYQGRRSDGSRAQIGGERGQGWDEHMFVSHDPEVARLYAGHQGSVHAIHMAPDTKVLKIDRANGPTWKRYAKGTEGQGLLDEAKTIVARAGGEGYHVVEFHRPHDYIGHVILDRSKVQGEEHMAAGHGDLIGRGLHLNLSDEDGDHELANKIWDHHPDAARHLLHTIHDIGGGHAGAWWGRLNPQHREFSTHEVKDYAEGGEGGEELMNKWHPEAHDPEEGNHGLHGGVDVALIAHNTHGWDPEKNPLVAGGLMGSSYIPEGQGKDMPLHSIHVNDGRGWRRLPHPPGLTVTAADDDEDWRGLHQPSMGPPIHNLLEKDEDGGQLAPDDIYTHMHYYTDGEANWDNESHAAIRKARGDMPLHQRPAAPAKMFSERAGGGEMSPAREAESDEAFAQRQQRRKDGEHHVTIYRAAPKGLKSIGPGDWVTPSPSYARDHARQASDPKKDWPVYKASVPAKHVRWAGDSLNEFGYSGPAVKPTYHTRGGTQAERLAAFVVEADQPYAGGYQFKFRKAQPNSMEAQADKTLNYHRLDAFHENTQDLTQGRGGHAGFLLWHHKTGEIGSIETLPEHQRRGLATEMLDQARQISATTRGVKPPKHSNQRTDAGEAWARSTGDRLPRRVQSLAAFVAALDPSEISETSPEEFHRNFSRSIAGSPFERHVTNHTPEEIRSEGMKPLTINHGTSGVLIHDHGDGRIEPTGLYNDREKGVKGAGIDLLKHAVEHHGANYFECYGPQLPKMYEKLGFHTTEKYPFDPSQAHPDWDYEQHNHPDYHIMRPNDPQQKTAALPADVISLSDVDWDDPAAVAAFKAQTEAELDAEGGQDWVHMTPEQKEASWQAALAQLGVHLP